MKWFQSAVVIEYCAERMAHGVKKFVLKSEVEELLDQKVEIYDYENLRTAARKLLREQAKVSLEDRQGNALSIYEAIISDPGAKDRDKLLALADMNDLLGVGAKWSDNVSPQEKAEQVRRFLKDTDDGSNDIPKA